LLLIAGVVVLLVSSLQLWATTLDEDIELILGAGHSYFFTDGLTPSGWHSLLMSNMRFIDWLGWGEEEEGVFLSFLNCV
jgi:hypothetical protein